MHALEQTSRVACIDSSDRVPNAWRLLTQYPTMKPAHRFEPSKMLPCPQLWPGSIKSSQRRSVETGAVVGVLVVVLEVKVAGQSIVAQPLQRPRGHC
jgi:hypothetical protein